MTKHWPTYFMVLFLTACATHIVKTTEYTQAIQATGNISEELLLDVGVTILDAGLDDPGKGVVNAEIRLAEARYSAFLLSSTLQRTGNWGIVYLLPNEYTIMDVYVGGTILMSNGEEMRVRITVRDSTGAEWYTKTYKEVISKFNYESSELKQHDPFQVLYNNIANDLLEFHNKSDDDIRIIRAISEIQFAQSFAPDAFSDYIYTDRRGLLQLNSLPAESDPLLNTIRTIRERDYMFVDTIQDYYLIYTRQMRNSYDSWRDLAYKETVSIRELETSALRKKVVGSALVIAGVVGVVKSDGFLGQTASTIAVGAGVLSIKEGFNKSAEAQMREETMRELSESFSNEVAPQTIKIEDRTVILTGNVNEQYKQWREILADMYQQSVE